MRLWKMNAGLNRQGMRRNKSKTGGCWRSLHPILPPAHLSGWQLKGTVDQQRGSNQTRSYKWFSNLFVELNWEMDGYPMSFEEEEEEETLAVVCICPLMKLVTRRIKATRRSEADREMRSDPLSWKWRLDEAFTGKIRSLYLKKKRKKTKENKT